MILILLTLTFISINDFIYIFFFEIRIIPTLILIIGWGKQFERIKAGIYILIYTLFGSLPIMIVLIKIYYKINIWNIILLNNLNLINNIYIYIESFTLFDISLFLFIYLLFNGFCNVKIFNCFNIQISNIPSALLT